MDKAKQVAPEVLSQPELLVSCFWGKESELQGFYLFYGESGVLGNDSGIDTILLEFASHFYCIFCTTFGYTFLTASLRPLASPFLKVVLIVS